MLAVCLLFLLITASHCTDICDVCLCVKKIGIYCEEKNVTAYLETLRAEYGKSHYRNIAIM